MRVAGHQHDIIRRAELPVDARARAGNQVAGGPIPAHGDRPDLGGGVDPLAGGVIAGQDIGERHAPRDVELGDRHVGGGAREERRGVLTASGDHHGVRFVAHQAADRDDADVKVARMAPLLLNLPEPVICPEISEPVMETLVIRARRCSRSR